MIVTASAGQNPAYRLEPDSAWRLVSLTENVSGQAAISLDKPTSR
jgi:hypothetical protein